jgi:small-conductance mechanosensitive channel
MNTIVSFLIEVVITVTICISIVAYIRPFLYRTLIDLCGTEERAQFWLAFSSILLIGVPFMFSLGFRPTGESTQDLFFGSIGRVGLNFGGFLFALIVIGMIVSFFALVAPKPIKAETK